jgi:hypothetical protein
MAVVECRIGVVMVCVVLFYLVEQLVLLLVLLQLWLSQMLTAQLRLGLLFVFARHF